MANAELKNYCSCLHSSINFKQSVALIIIYLHIIECYWCKCSERSLLIDAENCISKVFPDNRRRREKKLNRFYS